MPRPSKRKPQTEEAANDPQRQKQAAWTLKVPKHPMDHYTS